jgi:hypothetical protein
MLMLDPFLTFDTTPYAAVPKLPLQTLITLVNVLGTRVPGQAPAHVHEAAGDMKAAAKNAAKAMVVRLREINEIALAADLSLDNVTDNLFTYFRDGLRGWRVYLKPGLDFLLDDPEYAVKFQLTRERAERATTLLTQLFGDGNLAMLNRPFPEQAQLMNNVFDLIDEDGLEADLIDLTGDELLPLLRRVNKEYGAMVNRRAGEDEASEANLKVERLIVQRMIVAYANAVVGLVKPGKTELIPIVQEALEPMITMRPATTTGTSAEASDNVSDPAVDLANVLAAAQAELDETPPKP